MAWRTEGAEACPEPRRGVASLPATALSGASHIHGAHPPCPAQRSAFVAVGYYGGGGSAESATTLKGSARSTNTGENCRLVVQSGRHNRFVPPERDALELEQPPLHFGTALKAAEPAVRSDGTVARYENRKGIV